MNFLIPLSMIIWLCGCSATITETATETALEQLNTLEQVITPQCKTKAIESQINSIKLNIKQIEQSCKVEKDVLSQKIITRNIIILALGIIIILLLRKVI